MIETGLSPRHNDPRHVSEGHELVSPGYIHHNEDGVPPALECAADESLSLDEQSLDSFIPTFATNDPASEMMMQFLDLPDVDFGALSFLNMAGLDNLSQSPTSSDAVNRLGFLHKQAPYESITPQLQVTTSPSVPSEEYVVNITKQDHRLIQHFLNSMKQYSTKLRQTSEEDLNCEMFSNMGLFNAQVFHAMMAFSARHLSQTQQSISAEAELRYQQATSLLLQDEGPHLHMDVTIVTVWFLLQYELLFANGVVRFCNLLAHLSHVLDSYESRDPRVPDGLSILGARTLVWLSCYDARALASGGRGGYLLKSLESFLPLRPYLHEPSSSLDGRLLSLPEVFPPSHELDHTSTLRLRFRSNLLHGRILMLLSGLQDGSDLDVEESVWHSTHRDLLEMHDIFHRGTEELVGFPIDVAIGKMTLPAGTLSSLRFGHLLALSSLYAAFLDYHQALRAAKRDKLKVTTTCSDPTCRCHSRIFLSSAECAARMMHIAYCISLHRPKSPLSIWPSLLFVAGIESEDGIHREWLLNSLKGTETWAPHFLQTRKLLETILDHQLTSEKVVQADILSIQAEITGHFVI
jgi:hypothetical protein